MFDTKAQERIGYYVYALFDPQVPNIPFYVGKGCGNRVFSHANGGKLEPAEDEPLGPKLEQIATIHRAGGHVLHKIVRYGLSEDEAFKIEAAVIDVVNHVAPNTLKNQVSGHGVAEGMYDALDLATALCATELHSDLPLLVIKIEQQWTVLAERYGTASSIPRADIFAATRGTWKVNTSRASRAKCVLAVARGLVRAVFVPTGWSDAEGGRKQMTGEGDSREYQFMIGHSVAHLFERGSQNPIRYLRC